MRESLVVTLTDSLGSSGEGECAPWIGFGCEELEAAEILLRENRGNANFLPDRKTFPCLAHAFAAATFFMENPAAKKAPNPPAEKTTKLLDRSRETTPEEILTIVAREHAKGFRIFKIKIGLADFSREIAFCESVLQGAERLFPNAKIRFDANGAFPRDALPGLLALADSPALDFFEQPLAANAENDATIFALPYKNAKKIALDESLREPWTLPADSGVVAIVKPLLIGDFLRLRKWLARTDRPRVVLSSVFETNVGRAVLRELFASFCSSD